MKNVLLVITLASILLFSCNKDENNNDSGSSPKPDYQIETGTVTNISNFAAKANGTISGLNGTEITQYGHVWSTTPHPSIASSGMTELGSTSSDLSFTSNLSHLEKSTTYYIRAYSKDNKGTFYGEESSFTTLDSFFKFVVSSNYLFAEPGDERRAWILIYSTEGQLVDMTEVFSGNTYEFGWPAKIISETYMIQIFSTRISENINWSDNYSLNCYLNCKPDTWYLGKEPGEDPSVIGTSTISLIDFDVFVFDMWEAKSKLGWADYSDQMFSIPLYFAPDDHYVMLLNFEEAPYYYWQENVYDGETCSLSLSDFTQADDYIDIVFPGNNSDAVYIESEDDSSTDIWEYYTVFYNSADDESVIRAYYPGDLFSGYYTYLKASSDGVTDYMVKRRGTIPSQMEVIPVNISIISGSIDDFNATITGEADLAAPGWFCTGQVGNKESIFYYTLNGSPVSVSIFSAPDLPIEIKALNESLLDLNNLNYNGFSFKEYDNFAGYQDYLNNEFVEPGVLYEDVLNYYLRSIYSGKGQKPLLEDREEIKRVKHK